MGRRKRIVYFGQMAMVVLTLSWTNVFWSFRTWERRMQQLDNNSNNSPRLQPPPTHHNRRNNQADKNVVNNNNNNNDNMLFVPEQVLQKYIAWHGQDALSLHDSSQNQNRTYAIVYYSCPHRTGNALHAMFNAMIWAIMMNRTILWQYDTKATKTTVDDCNIHLERAAWLPSYDEWSTRLSLPSPPIPIKINTRWNREHAMRYYYSNSKNVTRRSYHSFTRQEQLQSWQGTVVIPPRFRDFVDTHDFNTTRVHWNDDPRKLLSSWWSSSSSLLDTTTAWYNSDNHYHHNVVDATSRQIMNQLYSEGLPFLYGMLFRKTFHIKAAAETRVVESSTSENNSASDRISIALHSRHSHVEWDGSDIREDVKCLKQLLQSFRHNNNINNKTDDCIVYMMSDRRITLDLLGTWVQQHGCRNVTVDHTTANTKAMIHHQGEFGWKPEMGIYGGGGFFRDLAFVSQARDGFIGQLQRSSTQLLLDLIEYDRKNEFRNRYGSIAATKQHLKPLQMCTYWRPR